MAKEYQRTSGGTLQWRDTAAGVQGWNNIERGEEPASQQQTAAVDNGARDSSGNRIPSTSGGGAAPASNPLTGLASAGGVPPATAPMPEFKPITAGGGGDTSSLIPSAPAPDSAGAAGSGIIGQGGMIPGPGFVESGQGAGALRGLGQRRPPENSMALAGLSRAY